MKNTIKNALFEARFRCSSTDIIYEGNDLVWLGVLVAAK